MCIRDSLHDMCRRFCRKVLIIQFAGSARNLSLKISLLFFQACKFLVLIDQVAQRHKYFADGGHS